MTQQLHTSVEGLGNPAKSVILRARRGALVGQIFASRQDAGAIKVEPIDDSDQGVAVKVIRRHGFSEADYAVRSIVTRDGRRKVEVLFGTVTAAVARSLDGFLSQVGVGDDDVDQDRDFAAGDTIYLANGSAVAPVGVCLA